MPVNNNFAQAAMNSSLRLPSQQSTTDSTPSPRLTYDKATHGNTEAFRASDNFLEFKKQYEGDLDALGTLADKYLPEDAHQLKSQIDSFKEHLLGRTDDFQGLTESMFTDARDAITGIKQLLSSEDIPAADKSKNLKLALSTIDQTTENVLSNLQTAHQQLKLAKQEATGETQVVALNGDSSLHRKNESEFYVKTAQSSEARAPRLEDLSSLALSSWGESFVSDLAKQAIGEASSVDELVSFSDKLQETEAPKHELAPSVQKFSKSLQNSLIGAMQSKIAQTPSLQIDMANKIQTAGSLEDLQQLQPLVSGSTDLKVVFLNRMDALDIPLTDDMGKNFLDTEVISKLPKAQLEKALDSEQRSTHLMNAAIAGHSGAVQALSDTEDVDINTQDAHGTTPLIMAAHKGHTEVVEKLLKAGNIDINQADNDGLTPLMAAASSGNIQMMTQLLTSDDIDVNKADNKGATPLTKAINNSHMQVVEQLLKTEGIEVNKADTNGLIKLMTTSYDAQVQLVKQLLEASDIDVNIAGSHGAT